MVEQEDIEVALDVLQENQAEIEHVIWALEVIQIVSIRYYCSQSYKANPRLTFGRRRSSNSKSNSYIINCSGSTSTRRKKWSTSGSYSGSFDVSYRSRYWETHYGSALGVSIEHAQGT